MKVQEGACYYMGLHEGTVIKLVKGVFPAKKENKLV